MQIPLPLATANPALEAELRHRMARLSGLGERPDTSNWGELEALALRLGLIQSTTAPEMSRPQLVIAAADHGVAVEGVVAPACKSTGDQLRATLATGSPLKALAQAHSIDLTVVDVGVSEALAPQARLVQRKVAHGSRNARITTSLSSDQALASIRAGLEFGGGLPGEVLACSALGVGSDLTASVLLSRLSGLPVREFHAPAKGASAEVNAHALVVAESAASRHRRPTDPLDMLSAIGGLDTAFLVGLMLAGAAQRRVLLIDGMAAAAALMLAARWAPHVVDYALFCTSRPSAAWNRVMGLFRTSALLELGLDAQEGTGAVLSWPLLRAASVLLTSASGQGEG